MTGDCCCCCCCWGFPTRPLLIDSTPSVLGRCSSRLPNTGAFGGSAANCVRDGTLSGRGGRASWIDREGGRGGGAGLGVVVL